MHIDGEKVANDINNSIDNGVEKAKDIIHDEATEEMLKAAKSEKDALIETVNTKLKESNISLPTEDK